MSVSDIFYPLGKIFFKIVFHVFWRARVIGENSILGQGSVIIASNHTSLADPPVVGMAVRRPVHFMAKQELFKIPILGWLIRHVGAIPLNRKGDVSALKVVERLLGQGKVLVLFPEGTRNRTGTLGRAKAGVGFLAARTRAPVIPCCVVNTDRLWRFLPVRVIFGKPLYFQAEKTRQDYQNFGDLVMLEIARLKDVLKE